MILQHDRHPLRIRLFTALEATAALAFLTVILTVFSMQLQSIRKIHQHNIQTSRCIIAIDNTLTRMAVEKSLSSIAVLPILQAEMQSQNIPRADTLTASVDVESRGTRIAILKANGKPAAEVWVKP